MTPPTNTAARSQASGPGTDHLEVYVLYCQGNFEEVQLSHGLVQLRLPDNLLEQLPALCKLQQNKQEIGDVDHILRNRKIN